MRTVPFLIQGRVTYTELSDIVAGGPLFFDWRGLNRPATYCDTFLHCWCDSRALQALRRNSKSLRW